VARASFLKRDMPHDIGAGNTIRQILKELYLASIFHSDLLAMCYVLMKINKFTK
jgi:hypothetical protein